MNRTFLLGRRRLKQLTLPQHELLRMHTAVWAMTRGTARHEEWDDLADLLAVVDALARMAKVDPMLVAPLIQDAIDGLAVAYKVPSGQMRVPGPAAHALHGIVTLYDACLSRDGQETIRDAIRLASVANDAALHGVVVLQD